jgi:hypothetical protein
VGQCAENVMSIIVAATVVGAWSPLAGMTNDEARMTKQTRITNDELLRAAPVRHSGFVIDFVIRH